MDLIRCVNQNDKHDHEQILSGFKIDADGSKIKSFKISCARGRKIRQGIDILIDIVFKTYTKDVEKQYKTKEAWLLKKEAFKTMFRQIKVIFNVLGYRGKRLNLQLNLHIYPSTPHTNLIMHYKY